MTPAELARKIGDLARVASEWPDYRAHAVAPLVKLAISIPRIETPEGVASAVILCRADLVRAAHEFEEKARELRAWAREIGEG